MLVLCCTWDHLVYPFLDNNNNNYQTLSLDTPCALIWPRCNTCVKRLTCECNNITDNLVAFKRLHYL